MSIKKVLSVWVAVLVFTGFAAYLLSDAQSTRALIEREIALAEQQLGASRAGAMVARANRWYQLLVVDTGVSRWVERQRESRHRRQAVLGGLSNALSHVMSNGVTLAYLMLYRLAWMTSAATPLAVMGVCALVDGLLERQRRAYGFAALNPLVYNLGQIAVALASLMPLAWLVVPIETPPLVLAAWGLGLAAAVWLVCAHLPGARPILAGRP